jgi:hypothetical protein
MLTPVVIAFVAKHSHAQAGHASHDQRRRVILGTHQIAGSSLFSDSQWAASAAWASSTTTFFPAA